MNLAKVFLILSIILLFNSVDSWRRRRRRRRPPPPPPCVCHMPAAPPPPYTGLHHGTGVCTVTEYRSQQYCTPCHCGSCPAYRPQAISVLRCCRGYSQSGNTCPNKIPCSSPPYISNGEFTPSKPGYAVGERVTYKCNTHYRLAGNTQLSCVIGPAWTPGPPSCQPIPCTNPPMPANSAIAGGAKGSYGVGTSITMTCKSGYRLISGSTSRTCMLGNRWSGVNVVCKPICFGQIDVCKNGGVCTSPDFCSKCNVGFYSPKCDPCPKITNCQLSVCSHPDPNGSNQCRTCLYDYGKEKGQAYQPSPDGKSCQKRCSWRADSNVCYAGTCELVESCKCATGFASPATQCRDIIEHPRINPGFLRLYYGDSLDGQNQLINVTKSMEGGGRLYTNAKIVKKISVSISANYIKNLPEAYPFIIRTSVGLSKFILDFRLQQGGNTVNILSISPTMTEPTGLLKRVHQVEQDIDMERKCGNKPCELSTNNLFRFTTSTKNGGFIVIHNPETKKDTRRDFSGKESHRTIEIAVDRDRPNHCSKTRSCGAPLTLSAAFTKLTSITATWGGWSDPTSGLSVFHVSVSEMTPTSDGRLDVGHGGKHIYHWTTQLSTTVTSQGISLPADKTGVYQVKLVVCDNVIERLKNCQPTRRFVLRDRGTSVTTTSTPIRVVGQISNDGKLWLQARKAAVRLEWTNHFENAEHVSRGVLRAIRPWPIDGEDQFYDQLKGNRNISAIANVRGIVQFQSQVKKGVNGQTSLNAPTDTAWKGRAQALYENFEYSALNYIDGETLRFWIEANDVIGNKKVESFTIHSDSTPPEIYGITLVKDGRTGINVHDSKELFKAKFLFYARDKHTGVYEVGWELYDNFTRSNLVRGRSSMGRQRYESIAACSAAHPASTCYTTPMSGVFSSKFEVELTKDGNLLPELDMAEHNHDLQFKVTVKNSALLQSQLTFQISIDTSGPHPGHVFDGVAGSPEVDYQSSNLLKGHWKDFWDKESAIKFYKYKFGVKCLTAESFSLARKDDETTNDFASWTAPGPGKYHLTVVAYNFALKPSVPVCSNGVVVDNVPPVLNSIEVKGQRTKPGLLIAPSQNVWFVDSNRRRRIVASPSAVCKSAATKLSEAAVGLIPLLTDPHRKIQPLTLTDDKCKEAGGFETVTVLPEDLLLNVSFHSEDKESGIEDVSVALATSESSSTPDLHPWKSTRRHSSVVLHHAQIRHGARMFVLLKARNGAQMTTSAVMGPLLVNVRSPATSGRVQVVRTGSKVKLSWASSSVVDSVTPFPLNFQLSAGASPFSADILPRRSVTVDASCKCVQVDMAGVTIVHGKDVHFTLHVGNVAGHWNTISASPFKWADFSRRTGVVHVIEPVGTVHHPALATPITAQSNINILRVVLLGFPASSEVKEGSLAILKAKTKETVKQQTVKLSDRLATFTGLSLKTGETYLARFTVTTSLGALTTDSSSVWILKANEKFSDVAVTAGDPCPNLKEKCDRTMQASTSHFHLRWTNAAALSSLHPRVNVYLESLSEPGKWSRVDERSLLFSGQRNFTFTGLSLRSGMAYRASVQLCIDSVCSANHPSPSMWVSVDSAQPGTLGVKLVAANKIDVELAKFQLRGFTLSQHDVYMATYEWRLTGGPEDMDWRTLHPTKTDDKTIFAQVVLTSDITSSKCVYLTVRGRTRSGIVSSIRKQIRSCSPSNPDGVRPNTVIDAEGELHFGDNFRWTKPDIDYLRQGNVLSAVWPTLRHGRFQWCLLQSPWTYKGGFFVTAETKLVNPSDHKNAIKCGITDKRYISLTPKDVTLQVDKRYHICIHANLTVRGAGSSREVLKPASACGDGVTVLSKLPKPGKVDAGPAYQSSANLLTLRWTEFFSGTIVDSISHHSVVKSYYYKIGTSPGGDNIIRYTSAGLANNVTVSRLVLQNAEKYYATIKAINLVDVVAEATSDSVTIDLRSPEVVLPNNFKIEKANGAFLNDVKVCSLSWTGVFVDRESGICSYQWCVGSRKGLCDIVKPKTVSGSSTSVSENLDSQLHDGHTYYINIRAFDCVGHSALFSSAAYQVVKTGPEVGIVNDGLSGEDLDYQRDTNKLSARWSGFTDRYTDIVEYKVVVGSFPGGSDIVSGVSVGLHTSVTFDHLQLRYGVKYQFGVTACNQAGMCSTARSDGILLDSTPPTGGRVFDGASGEEVAFQSRRSAVSFSLMGFADVESKLATMDWCITKTLKACDVTTAVTIPYEPFVRAQLKQKLPLHTHLRIRVIVRNHVGLSTEAISDGFFVDETLPHFTSPVTFDLREYSLLPNTQVAATVAAVSWAANGSSSGIRKQFISVASHSGAVQAVEPIQATGGVNAMKMTQLKLRDGYRYKAWVTVCNGATSCATSSSPDLLFDNSPAQLGMFLPRTNASHTHPGARNMRWAGSEATLSWQGFSDAHSGVKSYLVSIGSGYLLDDLLTRTKVQHKATVMEQENKFTLKRSLRAAETIYIALRATNGVGLNSLILHEAFVASSDGFFDSVRRCKATNCVGHCICAPLHHSCAPVGTCDDQTGKRSSQVVVKDIAKLSSVMAGKDEADIDFITESCTYAATWKGSGVQRYEVSAGLFNFPTPKGIFNPVSERIWFDVGQDTFAVLRFDNCMKKNTKYKFFVRAWYDVNTFAVFTSNGVTLVPETPQILRRPGSALREVKTSKDDRDLDFIGQGVSKLYVKWTNQFRERQPNSLATASVALGTYCGGSDVKGPFSLPATIKEYEFTGLTFKHGQRYMTTVRLCDVNGLCSQVCSDGVVADFTQPVSGLVVNSFTGLWNTRFQRNNTHFAASWKEFTDPESFITSYEWCLGLLNSSSTHSLKPWEKTGLRTHAFAQLKSGLKHSERVVVSVKAHNSVPGVTSSVVKGNELIIDLVPPYVVGNCRGGDVVVKNKLFSKFKGSAADLSSIGTAWWQKTTSTVEDWELNGANAAAQVVQSTFSHSEGTFVMVRGGLKQDVTTVVGRVYSFRVFVADILNDKGHTTKRGFVKIGNAIKHSFEIHAKRVSDIHLKWYPKQYHFKASSTKTTIELGALSADVEGLGFDTAILQSCTGTSSGNSISVSMEQAEHHVRLHSSLSAADDLSGVAQMLWALGTVRGGVQLQTYVPVDGSNSVLQSPLLRVPHGTSVHLSILVMDRAGTASLHFADGITVDFTPPEIVLRVGKDRCADACVVKTGNFLIHVDARDDESGIQSCSYALGSSKQGYDLVNFKAIKPERGEEVISKEVQYIIAAANGKIVYPTVICINRRGMSTTKALQHGIRIITEPPSAANAYVNLVTPSSTHFPRTNPHQADRNKIVFTWGKFFDASGSSFYYQYSLTGPSGSAYRGDYRRLADSRGRMVMLDGLDLSDGATYTLRVRAVNEVQLTSRPVSTEVKVDSENPKAAAGPLKIINHSQSKITLDWTSIFTSKSLMFYEVSAGSGQGRSDVFSLLETKKTTITLDKVDPLSTYFISITAISSSGLYTQKLYKVQAGKEVSF